ncbi:hypothetical protein CAPTEDRAFT_228590 [Capitella teleta]|uniref:GST C-terminal domain-containing protein n=1 Tax=Capitella teleta TaxID=283909 RepID=R7V8F3_CAPTE|nr:hypothetical protein CAPTEDRAFT_228590 [Capitella teleta]|eukprot:ELU15128.1 hypothetical protein CAPTEDRAFT_228590 [Capitella teleta]
MGLVGRLCMPPRVDGLVLLSAGFFGGALVSYAVQRYLKSKQRLGRVYCRSSGRMKLFTKNSFRSASVLWALHELNLQDECDIIDEPSTRIRPSNGDISPGVDPMNIRLLEEEVQPPILQLPSGKSMHRADAICLYLAELCEDLQASHDFLPQYYSWSLYASETLDPWIQILLVEKYLTRESRKNRDLQRQTSTKLLQGIHDLNNLLSQQKYIAGNRFSMADVIVGYSIIFTFFINYGQIFVDLPNVRAYLDRVTRRKSFLQTVGTQENWREIVNILQTEPL